MAPNAARAIATRYSFKSKSSPFRAPLRLSVARTADAAAKVHAAIKKVNARPFGGELSPPWVLVSLFADIPEALDETATSDRNPRETMPLATKSSRNPRLVSLDLRMPWFN